MPDQTIELSYDSIDLVPESFRSLYDEEDGKAILKGVSNLKTPQDISNVQEALRKEREDHKKVKEQLSAWGDLKHEEVQAKLDRIAELEAAAEGKIDEEKMNEIIENRLKQKTGPIERKLADKEKEAEELLKQLNNLQESIETRDRNDVIRSVALEMKVHNSAIDDILLVAGQYFEKTDDGKFIVKPDANGVTPGLDPKGFMKEMRKNRPHWWPDSEGGGAGGAGGPGGDGNNPWSHDNWNFTQQSNIIREQGMSVAETMAKAAGTTVGGLKPPKKN